ncbi:MAG: RlmE family RNA methyltransferase [Deltaproteobacteria bacterium]|nr:RlmE family RNA methyltransferase [Deltaproteobacteria bacterium]
MARKPHYDKRDQKVATTGGHYKRHDVYWARAKDEGYAARSVYKLQEIDKAHQLMGPGSRVLDLGCAPGSWLQFAAERVGSRGRVVGVDLEVVKLDLPPHVTTLAMDMVDLTQEHLPSDCLPLDLVMSDLAPHTTGIRSVDQARSFDLSARALLCCDVLLRPGGHFVVKTFQGPDTQRLLLAARMRFDRAEIIRPKATRQASAEVYLLALGRRATRTAGKDPLEVL